MAKPMQSKFDRLNVHLDDSERKWLEKHRQRLEKARGEAVSRSDAVRDAIRRTATMGA